MNKKYVLDSPQPDYIFHRLTDITVDELKKWGVKAVGLDIDNTLTYDMTYSVPEEGIQWVKAVKKAGYPVVLVSNTFINRAVYISFLLGGVPFIAPAIKPYTYALKLAARLAKVKPDEMVMIGDQIFKDCLCANRVGAVSVRVDPFAVETVFARHHEKRRKKEAEYYASLENK
ncbi:MAG: YqeG family HAD IIIA-type phosphatase [Clostridia bacterium]|nr:YqeG family HAD IIIA-type phosphatase [Clostridia bacterium]